jgi:hypothetical protein
MKNLALASGAAMLDAGLTVGLTGDDLKVGVEAGTVIVTVATGTVEAGAVVVGGVGALGVAVTVTVVVEPVQAAAETSNNTSTEINIPLLILFILFPSQTKVAQG